MSIFFCGDVHGQFDHVIEAARVYRPAAIVLLGDVQAPRPLEVELADILDMTEVWFIHGNHDSDSDGDHDHLFCSALGDRNLHGRVVEVAGVRIAGLGGIFRGQVWRPPAPALWESKAVYCTRMGKANLWRGGLSRTHRTTIFPEDYNRLASMRADVLVTHEAPSAHPYGFAAIDALARSLHVRKTFHGHQHDRLDYSQALLGFEARGVGLRGITDLDGTVIRVGECDDARATRHVRKAAKPRTRDRYRSPRRRAERIDRGGGRA